MLLRRRADEGYAQAYLRVPFATDIDLPLYVNDEIGGHGPVVVDGHHGAEDKDRKCCSLAFTQRVQTNKGKPGCQYCHQKNDGKTVVGNVDTQEGTGRQPNSVADDVHTNSLVRLIGESPFWGCCHKSRSICLGYPGLLLKDLLADHRLVNKLYNCDNKKSTYLMECIHFLGISLRRRGRGGGCAVRSDWQPPPLLGRGLTGQRCSIAMATA